MSNERKHIFKTAKEWTEEGKRRFGPHLENWKFKCPFCGRVNSGQEYKDIGADPNSMYCECIGRYDKTKGCNWAAYGFFDICTSEVEGHPVFDFADMEYPVRSMDTQE